MTPDGAATARRPLPYGDVRHQLAHQFLVEEAHLLDTMQLERWLELLTEDVRYRMPVRVTTMRDHEGSVLGAMDHFDEDLHSLRKRVERFGTDLAWTEDPPSRVRHLVTNVRTFAVDDAERTAELDVESAVLLFRSRIDQRPPDLVSAGRSDRLRRRADGSLCLVERVVSVDEAVLRTQNLAIFL